MKYIPAIALFAVLVKAMVNPIDYATAFSLLATSGAFVLLYVTELKRGVDFEGKIQDVYGHIVSLRKDFGEDVKELTVLSSRLAHLEQSFDEVHKLADETKKVVSSANLGMAFRPPTRRNTNGQS